MAEISRRLDASAWVVVLVDACTGAAVKEVWLVLVPEQQIEVYRQPNAGSYSDKKTVGPGGNLSNVALPHFSIKLDDFFKA